MVYVGDRDPVGDAVASVRRSRMCRCDDLSITLESRESAECSRESVSICVGQNPSQSLAYPFPVGAAGYLWWKPFPARQPRFSLGSMVSPGPDRRHHSVNFYSANSKERTLLKSRSISEFLFLNQSVDQIRCIAHP